MFGSQVLFGSYLITHGSKQDQCLCDDHESLVAALSSWLTNAWAQAHSSVTNSNVRALTVKT